MWDFPDNCILELWGVPRSNPFKPGELMDRPAKPTYNKVKVRAMKLLRGMAK